jgi:hypothetical protein
MYQNQNVDPDKRECVLRSKRRIFSSVIVVVFYDP